MYSQQMPIQIEEQTGTKLTCDRSRCLSERTQQSTCQSDIAGFANQTSNDDSDKLQSPNTKPSQDCELIGRAKLVDDLLLWVELLTAIARPRLVAFTAAMPPRNAVNPTQHPTSCHFTCPILLKPRPLITCPTTTAAPVVHQLYDEVFSYVRILIPCTIQEAVNRAMIVKTSLTDSQPIWMLLVV